MSRTFFAGRAFAAFLFDMDGTLLTSVGASERVWSRWAADFGLDAAAFLPRSHGMRVVEVIERLAIPGVDAVEQAEVITRAEIDDVGDVRAVRGAATFLASLPADRWALVTSAPLPLVRARLAAAGLPEPATIVSGHDVGRGKPDPACFLLGAQRLGVRAADCLVFEDAEAGIVAAERAGAEVVAVTAAHPAATATGRTAVLDFSGVRAEAATDGRLRLVEAGTGA